MITFICAIVLLLAGYWLYGRLAETVFRPDDRPTPAMEHPDGVDYVPMKTWRVFLIQLLNIAGTGPIFGPLMGAVFGPVVFLWIVFGSILGGAVHDYMSGMISVRMNGASVSEIVGKYLGGAAKQIMRVFSVILLVLVGAVFTTSPAALIARLTPEWMDTQFWVVVILIYYLLATLLPIDKLIGKLYPLFGCVLLLMVVGIIGGLVAGGYTLPELVIADLHPDGLPVWPFMFVTVACGAVSGFHSLIGSGTTSKQLDSEKDAKVIGYGAMIVESALAIIALIAIGVVYTETDIGGGDKFLLSAPPTIFAGGVATMVATMTGGIADFSNPVYDTAYTLLTLAVSVFALTSLDSGTRLARYMFAELFIPEGKTRDDLTGAAKFFSHPFVATGVMVIIGCSMGFMGLSQIWGVFGAANQLLAGIAMLAVATWLGNIGKNNKMFFVPMVFMLVATITSLCMTVIAKVKLIAAAGAAWGDWFQMIWSIGLVVLAIILVIQGIQILSSKKEQKAA